MMPSVLVTHRIPASVISKLELSCDVDLHSESFDLFPDELQKRVKGRPVSFAL